MFYFVRIIMYFNECNDRVASTITLSELNCLREVLLNDVKNRGLENELAMSTDKTKRHWQKMINHRDGMLVRIEEELLRHSNCYDKG